MSTSSPQHSIACVTTSNRDGQQEGTGTIVIYACNKFPNEVSCTCGCLHKHHHIPLNTRRDRHPLPLAQPRIQPVDPLRLAVRQMGPHEVPYGRRDALLQLLPHLLALARLGHGDGRGDRYSVEFAFPVRLGRRGRRRGFSRCKQWLNSRRNRSSPQSRTRARTRRDRERTTSDA